jgi:hypothetical protein
VNGHDIESLISPIARGEYGSSWSHKYLCVRSTNLSYYLYHTHSTMETRQRAREHQAMIDAATTGGGGDTGTRDVVLGDTGTEGRDGEDTADANTGADTGGRGDDATGGGADGEGQREDEGIIIDPMDPAQLRAFKAFLRYIGFTPDAITQIFVRGLSSMDSLQDQEKNQVANMCKCIERGTNGTPGIPLNSDSIKWLKLGTYAIKRRQYCGWQTTTMDLTKTELQKWSNFKQSEEDYKEPTDPPTNDSNRLFKDWSKTFKILDRYIGDMRGDDSKIPLGAIIRKLEDPSPLNLGTPNDYLGIIDIMTQHYPHWEYDLDSDQMKRPYFYSQDNHKVLKILLNIFQNTPAYTYIERFERKRDGRGAYWALFDHYLGQHQVTHMVSKALHALETLQYTGEKKDYNWEKHVNRHVRNHNVLDSMVGRGDFRGLGESQKIRKLLDGIHCPPLEFMKATILGQPDVYKTFHKASMLFGDYIQHNKSHLSVTPSPSAGVAATQAEVPQSESKKEKSITKTKKTPRQALDHWTEQPEWKTLTPEQQKWLQKQLQGTTDDSDEEDQGSEEEDEQARVARECKKRKAKHQKANRTWSSAYKLPVVDSTDEETGNESDGSEKK